MWGTTSTWLLSREILIKATKPRPRTWRWQCPYTMRMARNWRWGHKITMERRSPELLTSDASSSFWNEYYSPSLSFSFLLSPSHSRLLLSQQFFPKNFPGFYAAVPLLHSDLSPSRQSCSSYPSLFSPLLALCPRFTPGLSPLTLLFVWKSPH